MNESFFSPRSPEDVAAQLGKDKLLEMLRKMILIRHFEVRGESAYQHGYIGGFYHSYSGEEAIQTSAIEVFGQNNWYIGFYRCHALALLLGATPNELMAELYGKATGNAKGRGGSMHLYADRLLGGFGIVGGHLPIAIGAAFSLKYQNIKDQIALCFLGEGAVAQGAFHESLNLAALWDLPILFVIENNHWGMGTHVSRAIAAQPIAELQAPSYGIKGYTLNGMDFLSCYGGFEAIKKEILTSGRPAIAECICDRFRGHSISDPGLYRSKDDLQKLMQQDPIISLKDYMLKKGLLTEEEYKEIDKEEKQIVIDAMKYAEESPWPNPATLEEGVYAP